jgi:adenylate cyclase
MRSKARTFGRFSSREIVDCYGQLGRVDEAHEACREALRVNPAYSLEHRRKVLPYKNTEDFERVVEGLRKAGPEE